MEFLTTQNPEVALTLIPWFVPTTQTREDIYLELIDRLTHTPDETFVCLVLDGDLIKGMAVAYCRLRDVFIWQARSEGLRPRFVDMAFERICDWAKSKGFNRITGMPNRAKKIWQRRWGFEELNETEVYKEI